MNTDAIFSCSISITPDSKGNVWIGGNGGNDGHILKFTQDGKFIKQFGFAYANAGSNDTWAFNKVAKVSLDEKANEAYVSDGYSNKRVAVLDMNMPGMSGLELAERIRATQPDMKLALLTANVQEAIQRRAAALGVRFFRKPISETVIADVLGLLD